MAIHLIYLLRRLPHVSFEGFDAHRGQIHGALIAALPAIKSGVVKYKQFHVLPETNAALAAQGMPVMTYDGIAELEAEKLEDILELFASDEMAKTIIPQTIIPDEKHFFDRSGFQVVAGDWKMRGV